MEWKWNPSNFFLAQAGHLLLGLLAVLGPIALALQGVWGIYGAVTIGIYFVVKELTFDIWVEGETYADAVIDIAFFLAGVLAAFIAFAAIAPVPIIGK